MIETKSPPVPSDLRQPAASTVHRTPDTRSAPPSELRGLVRAARPDQWTKNLIVFAAPLVDPTHPMVALWWAVPALIAFTCAAAGTYLLNDVLDRDADALHPRKRHRPIASGTVRPRVAATVAACLLAAAVVIPLLVDKPTLSALVAGYAALAIAYSTHLKRVPYVELVVVSAFVVLRVVAGAVTIEAALPAGLLIAFGMAAVHLVTGKRYAELRDLGDRGTRRVLGWYSTEALGRLLIASAGLAITAYATWMAGAVWSGWSASRFMWSAVSVGMLITAFHRYRWCLAAGAGERPERLVWTDLKLAGALAATTLAAVAVVEMG